MSIDAMYWVWLHSQSKGAARHVMLAIANWAPGPECEVRAGTAALVQFSNAARSSVIKAVDALVKLGELEIVEEGVGTRPTLYRLPRAVGFVRPDGKPRGPKTGPLEGSQGSENETPRHMPRGPKTTPEGSENETPRGPKTGPQYQSPSTSQQDEAEEASDDDRYPAQVLPLVHAMGASGLTVRWPFEGNQWFPLIAIIRRSGVQAMVEHAHRSAAHSRTPVTSAKYFIAGWRELPPLPPEGTPVYKPTPHLRAVGQTPEERGVF